MNKKIDIDCQSFVFFFCFDLIQMSIPKQIVVEKRRISIIATSISPKMISIYLVYIRLENSLYIVKKKEKFGRFL